MKKAVRSLAATALLVACAFAFSACSYGISVVADPTDLIRSARFIDSEDLPVAVAWQEMGQIESEGAMILPGSEPRRLLIGAFGGCCRPTVTVAAPEVTGQLQINVAVSRGTGQTCCDALVLWPLEVILTRDVDPASVVLVVMSQPS